MTHFSWLDYTIFGVYLTASVGVGLFSARGAKSLSDYFLAGRGMNSILVAMSILAALFSGISYLAGPADVYKNGFGFAYVVLAFFIATPFPGTAFFRRVEAEGRLHKPIDWGKYNCANVVFKPARTTEQEVVDGFTYLWREFFAHSDPSVALEPFHKGALLHP